jgi:hypothetical protein
LGRVGGVLVLAFMRAWRLLPEPEMRTLTLAGEGMVGVCLGGVARFSMVFANEFTYMERSCDVQKFDLSG